MFCSGPLPSEEELVAALAHRSTGSHSRHIRIRLVTEPTTLEETAAAITEIIKRHAPVGRARECPGVFVVGRPVLYAYKVEGPGVVHLEWVTGSLAAWLEFRTLIQGDVVPL